MLATVEGSPAAVAAHDRDAWLALFDENGLVNDPVGSTPHRGADELGRFYDTFIAPNTVTFRPDHDIVCGNTVVRDLTLEIEMSGAVALHVPAHLRYELSMPSRIAGLYAHWELPGMVGQMLGKGLGALPVSGKLSARLVKNQGLRGSLGFGRGFFRVGDREKNALRAVFENPALDVPVTYGTADPAPASALVSELRGWQPGKTIAAGHTVTASLRRGDERAVAMGEFSGRTLTSVRVYVDE